MLSKDNKNENRSGETVPISGSGIVGLSGQFSTAWHASPWAGDLSVGSGGEVVEDGDV